MQYDAMDLLQKGLPKIYKAKFLLRIGTYKNMEVNEFLYQEQELHKGKKYEEYAFNNNFKSETIDQ